MIREVRWVKNLLSRLSQPHSRDSQVALREFITKVVLLVLALVSVIFALVFSTGWVIGIIPLDTLVITLLAGIVFVVGWVLAHVGMWRASGFLPPAFLLCTAVYGNYIGGIGAPAMLIYILPIIMVAAFRGVRAMYWTLLITVLAFLSLGLAHHFGLFTRIRTAQTAFANRTIIVIAVMIGITLLVHFLILEFRKALQQAQEEIRKREEIAAALEESEKKYRELVQNANSIILKLNTQGEITFVNEYAERFFGYSGQEILGRSMVGTILPEAFSNGEDSCRLVTDVLGGPSQYRTHENENITRDGRRVWINWTNKPITDEEGRLVGLLCVGNDNTDRHREREEREKIQSQLLQAQKMEAIGTLTSGFAHDFNNILSGIMGSLSLLNHLLKKGVDPEREKVEKYLQIAVDSAQRASQMIRQLLLLSRKQEIRALPVDLNTSISHVVDICKNSFPKSVRIRVHEGETRMVVMADPIIIEQVLLNFCVNASQAMTIMKDEPSDEGGYLDIAVSRVGLGEPDQGDNQSATRAGPFIRISISDTGVGMDADTQKRIFEPFFSLNKRGKGTGLGLSMAHDFIYQAGGFIELQSKPRGGTTFHVYLPSLEDGEGLDLWEKPQRSLVPGKGTVLVIDDEKQILAVAEETLKTCGYRVLLAHDGIEGIELFKTGRDSISAVLLDISMPYMSGHKVCEKIKEIQPSVKVLMSSGYADDERLKTALKMGASGFIQKPYTAEELSRSMDVLLKESPPVCLDPPRKPDSDGRGAT